VLPAGTLLRQSLLRKQIHAIDPGKRGRPEVLPGDAPLSMTGWLRWGKIDCAGIEACRHDEPKRAFVEAAATKMCP